MSPAERFNRETRHSDAQIDADEPKLVRLVSLLGDSRIGRPQRQTHLRFSAIRLLGRPVGRLDGWMLSIAKLAAGGQRYYLEQAKARVDHERSVASGVEDYYLSGPEPAGRWVGSVAERGGYGGELVGEDALHRALSWADPLTGEDLEGPVQRARVPGFDLMFSVPKSASVLMGVGGPRVQRAVRDAQAVAVREAMRYLEKTAARTRMGCGGQVVIEGRGLLGAAFEHRTSRSGDPQLHTHVLVANAIERPDGKFGTLDGRAIYAEARTAGFIHEAAFRRALTDALGVEWEPARNGIADVAGIDASVLERSVGGFRRSTRRSLSGARRAPRLGRARRCRPGRRRTTGSPRTGSWPSGGSAREGWGSTRSGCEPCSAGRGRLRSIERRGRGSPTRSPARGGWPPGRRTSLDPTSSALWRSGRATAHRSTRSRRAPTPSSPISGSSRCGSGRLRSAPR